jgi:hypothetical protein
MGNDPTANIIARLPDGSYKLARQEIPALEVETSLSGARFHGFAASEFLKPAPDSPVVPVPVPSADPPTTGIVAVIMPRQPGTITKRSGGADAHSLNEPNQPSRKGTTADERARNWQRSSTGCHWRNQQALSTTSTRRSVTFMLMTIVTRRGYLPRFGGHHQQSKNSAIKRYCRNSIR